MMTRNEDRPVAVVTGASRALGKAIALKLARAGYDVSLAARSEDALEELRQDLANEGAYSMVTAVDLANCDDRATLLESTVAHMGRIDVLVNGASSASLKPFAHQDWDEMNQQFDVSLLAPVHLSHLALRYMAASRSGAIVNLSGLTPPMFAGGTLVDGVVQSGLNEFTRMLRAEAESLGVSVSAVLPSETQSPTSVASDVLGTLIDDGLTGASGRSRRLEMVA